MSQHQGDVLRYRERTYELADRPLEAYFDLISARPDFQTSADGSSVYSATWIVEDGWLFLRSLDGFWSEGTPLSVGDLFPSGGSKVFAAWWSGLLRGYRSDASLLTRASVSRSPDILIHVEYGRISASSMVHRSSRKEGAMPTNIRPNPTAVQERSVRGAIVQV